jgi:hypothetical protein
MPNPDTPYYFVSYSRKDKDFVGKLVSDLERQSIALWVDRGQIEGGESWTREIEEGIEGAKGMILILSPDSVASEIVNKEISAIHPTGKPIIPVLLEACDRPLLVNDLHYIDFARDYRESFLELLHRLDPTQGKERSVTFTFGKHHQYLCDRVPQRERFIEAYMERKKRQKNAFFYFHGGDRQAHEGLFQRFVHRLKGNDRPGDYLPPGYQVESFRVEFPDLSDAEALQIDIPRALFKKFKIPEAKMERIRKKDLSFSLEQSPVLKGMESQDKVCVLFTLDHAYWNKESTTEVVRWFVYKFCLEGYDEDEEGFEREKEILAEGPDFYFFFALEYDSDEELELKDRIEQEVQEALRESRHVVALPVLDMVNQKDIRYWFKKYRDYLKPSPDLPEPLPVGDHRAWHKVFFGEKEPEMYMEEVQAILKQVIKKVNGSEKHRPRHS